MNMRHNYWLLISLRTLLYKDKLKFYYVWSVLFCKYSSSALFGTEYDSPLPLRYFAICFNGASISISASKIGF
ncbi:hypothetical protein [Arsenophonus endosymbiont of Aleurodicus floccissimus]|uniref:hypothetical protein n=1 Tax=Arsenophonus endosymbiont of Aleurodicus floccissimus TaxID=2152761 RepID=UPI000E6B1F12